jgi:hypothetical protein
MQTNGRLESNLTPPERNLMVYGNRWYPHRTQGFTEEERLLRNIKRLQIQEQNGVPSQRRVARSKIKRIQEMLYLLRAMKENEND